jgi:hypothetical protein
MQNCNTYGTYERGRPRTVRTLVNEDAVILWTSEEYFTRDGRFNVHKSHFWARDNHHAICERVYQVRFSVSVRTGIVGAIVVGPNLLPDSLTAH